MRLLVQPDRCFIAIGKMNKYLSRLPDVLHLKKWTFIQETITKYFFYFVTSRIKLERGKVICWTNTMISRDVIVDTHRAVLYSDWKDEYGSFQRFSSAEMYFIQDTITKNKHQRKRNDNHKCFFFDVICIIIWSATVQRWLLQTW